MEKVVVSLNSWVIFKAFAHLDEEILGILESGKLIRLESLVNIPEMCHIKGSEFITQG